MSLKNARDDITKISASTGVMKEYRKRKNKKKGICLLLILLVVIIAAGICYMNDYYRSDKTAAQYFQKEGSVKIKEIDNGLFLDGPGEENALIFYPGAKVEYTAYIPMLFKLAEEDVDVFLIHMPCNLAIFGQNAADHVMNQYSYEAWYMGGHSLGGAMAASYTAKHLDCLNGLVLLAAYPTKSLQEGDLAVLSVYGSEDQVLNMEKVKEGRAYMPKDYTEICIEGGNHAQFGNYGFQDGDGNALISAEEQQTQTIQKILQMTLFRE